MSAVSPLFRIFGKVGKRGFTKSGSQAANAMKCKSLRCSAVGIVTIDVWYRRCRPRISAYKDQLSVV